MRVVIDANVFVSAVISTGVPKQVIDRWYEGCFDLVISPAILEEIERVFRYPKLSQRYNLPWSRIEGVLMRLRSQADQVVPSQRLDVIEQDPSDHRYAECAVEGGAEILVSGDRHLLALGEYQGVQVLDPAGFLAWLELQG